MRVCLPLSVLLLATACGSPHRDAVPAQSENMPVAERSMSTADVASPTPPGFTPTAAPGVAFNYRYAFRLPAKRISEVQEQHAALCEKLGVDRCRITGLLYRFVNDHDIEGMLALKLDPAIARQFGKQGIEAVTRAEGMLTESEITGEDAGSEIAAATRNVGQLEEDLRKVEAQLANKGLRSAERAELQVQAQQLRESIRATRATRAERQESLAKTPVVFRYGSGDLAPGFDNGSPIGKAFRNAGDNLAWSVAALIQIVLAILPWALVLALGWWAVFRVRRGLQARAIRAEAA
jgi:hypothetical protein